MGVFRYANSYPDALALFGAGRLANVHKLVTTRFKLSEVGKAFETLARGVDDEGKMGTLLFFGPLFLVSERFSDSLSRLVGIDDAVMKIMVGDY